MTSEPQPTQPKIERMESMPPEWADFVLGPVALNVMQRYREGQPPEPESSRPAVEETIRLQDADPMIDCTIRCEQDDHEDDAKIVFTLKAPHDQIEIKLTLMGFLVDEALILATTNIQRKTAMNSREFPAETGIEFYRKVLDVIQDYANSSDREVKHVVSHSGKMSVDRWMDIFNPVFKDEAREYDGPFPQRPLELYTKVYKPEKTTEK